MVYFVHKKELGSSSPLISIYFSSDNIQQFGRNTLLTQFIIFQLQFVQQFFRIIVRRLAWPSPGPPVLTPDWNR